MTLRPLAPAALLLGLTACSPGGPKNDLTGTEVSGMVTLDGRPLNAGTVMFTTGTDSATAQIQKDGTYKVLSAPTGACKVAVTTTDAESAAGAAKRGNIQSKGKGGEPAPIPEVIKAPAKYRNTESSGLTFTVKAGPNTFDIKLSK